MKHLLLIAYNFPPMENIGALRPWRLAKYLPAFGWKTTVLTVQNDWSYKADSSFNIVDSKHMRIVRVPRLPLTRILHRPLRKIFGQNPLWYSYIDPFYDWYPLAKMAGDKILKHEKVDLICATAPPYTSLRLARSLSNQSGIPAIADLRDPFSQSIYFDFPTSFHRIYYQKYEENLLKRFQHIIVAWPRIAEWNAKAFGIPMDNFTVITNGYEPDDFKRRYHMKPVSSEFRIGFFGSIYGARSVEPLFKALSVAYAKRSDFRKNSKVYFAGSHGSYNLSSLTRKYGIGQNLVMLDFLPHHSDVLDWMSSCHILVMFAGMVNESFPGKMYEYIASHRPILSFSNKGSLWDLIEETRIGVSVMGSDYEEAGSILLKWYDRFMAHQPLHEFDESRVERFDGFNLTGDFARVFDSTLERRLEH